MNEAVPRPRSPWREAWPDALAFIAVLGLAWHFRWQTVDLVWSLWLSSLLIFFFAAAKFAQLDSFLVYAVVYAGYFFPWRILSRRKEAVA